MSGVVFVPSDYFFEGNTNSVRFADSVESAEQYLIQMSIVEQTCALVQGILHRLVHLKATRDSLSKKSLTWSAMRLGECGEKSKSDLKSISLAADSRKVFLKKSSSTTLVLLFTECTADMDPSPSGIFEFVLAAV